MAQAIEAAGAGRDLAGTRRMDARVWTAALALAAALVLLAPALACILRGTPITLEDDAYYYAVIARRLAHGGPSSFDGISLTNGYHPLWLALLVIKERLFGPSAFVTLIAEAALMGAGLFLLLRRAAVRSLAVAAVFAGLYLHYVGAMAMAGMEVSLFTCAAALFIWTLGEGEGAAAGGGLRLGLAAALCIGARIDAAAFVLPVLVLAPQPRRSRAVALALLAGLGALYAAVDLALFGAALPISSAVKSLGGLQVNHRYLDQLAGELRAPGGHGRHLLTLALCAAAPLVSLAAPQRSAARALGFGTAIGGALFFFKLAFVSSWRVWPWYDFPLLFALATGLLALAPRVEAWRTKTTLRRVGVILLALAACAGVGRQTVKAMDAQAAGGFLALDRAAAIRFAPVLGGAPVAMGDRAGAFADVYPGRVIQLEGLVEDAAWLRRLKQGGDMTPEVCARGARFLLAWRPELGDYAREAMPVMRTALTQFRAPTVTVLRADELARLSDPAVYRHDAGEEADDILYLWRLRCPGAAAAR